MKEEFSTLIGRRLVFVLAIAVCLASLVGAMLAWVSPVQGQAPYGLLLSEVFYDAVGGDNQLEWVEIANTTLNPIDLSGYSLGYGGTDYTYGTYQLAGTIPGRGCWVVGGPTSNATNYNPTYNQSSDFNPDIQNGGTASDAVALFDVLASSITPSTVPIDAVIYDSPNTNSLMDETGNPGTPDVGDAPNGSSVERTNNAGSWQIQSSPNPNSCSSLVDSNAIDIHSFTAAATRNWLSGMLLVVAVAAGGMVSVSHALARRRA